MRRNINILASDLAPSQLNYYLIRNTNYLHEHHKDINVQVFTENLSRFCMKPLFGVMNVSEAWGQGGPFIATNLSTASKLINYPIASRKLFYIWDLEFLRGSQRVYDLYAPYYLHPELELVCRSQEHKDLVENCFNREVKNLVNNFNMNEFIQILQ
jgi:hypothetical protein